MFLPRSPQLTTVDHLPISLLRVCTSRLLIFNKTQMKMIASQIGIFPQLLTNCLDLFWIKYDIQIQYKYDIQVQYRDIIEIHDDAKLDLSSLADESLGLHLTLPLFPLLLQVLSAYLLVRRASWKIYCRCTIVHFKYGANIFYKLYFNGAKSYRGSCFLELGFHYESSKLPNGHLKE